MRYYPDIFLDRLGKIRQLLVRIGVVPVEIQTEYCQCLVTLAARKGKHCTLAVVTFRATSQAENIAYRDQE
jgi:hypothetical protein